jgi:hypothetical protein
MIVTQKWHKHACLPGTYFFFSYTLVSPLMVLYLSAAHFLNQSSHPFKGVNSVFSFKALSSAFCFNIGPWIGLPEPFKEHRFSLFMFRSL